MNALVEVFYGGKRFANTFLYTGASAIALWGSTNGSHPLQPEGTGPDGTEGNYPRFTLVEGNFIRFLGIHEKQARRTVTLRLLNQELTRE